MIQAWTRIVMVLLLAVSTAAVTVPNVASAQELPEDELEEGRSSFREGPPVRRLLLLRAGRFEIQPAFMFSLAQPFSDNLMAGLQLNYYFTNSLGVGASFGFGLAGLDTDETAAVASANYPESVKRSLTVNDLFINFDLGVVWVPIFGKVSIFNWIVNYDIHLFAGVGGLILEPRCADPDNAGCQAILDNQADGLGGFKIGGSLGIGARLYFNNFMALNVEVHDYLLSYSEYGRDGKETTEFQQFIVPMVGLSFFLPLDVLISR